MNVKKIGLLTVTISLLTTLGLCSKKANEVKAEDPEPIVLDLHEEYILDKIAARLNDTHDDWENAITTWINDPTEIMGIKFFNMDIDTHTFVVEDVEQVKNFVYIEYLFLNYHLDYVDLPNIEVSSIYHEYKRGLDYVRGLLDSFLPLGSDIASLFAFDYVTPLDNSNPDDIQKVTDLVTTAYNLYQNITTAFIDHFNIHEIDPATFFVDTTGDVKDHYVALSNIFIADPSERENETYTFGPYLLRIYRLLRYTVWDSAEECADLITPLTSDEIIAARNCYNELKENYEAEYGSWFDTTVDPAFIKNYIINLDSYCNYSGLVPLFFVLDLLGELEKNSNSSSGFTEFFSSNFGPLAYKVVDLIEATSANDIPNIGIIANEIVADSITFLICFYDNCVYRMKDTNELAKKLYDTQTAFSQLVSDIEYTGLTIEEAIPTIINIISANNEIRSALTDSEETIENTQILQSFNHYLVNFNAFKEEYTTDMVDCLSSEYMQNLSGLSDEAAELISQEIANPDDLIEFRTKVNNIQEKYNEYLTLLAQKATGLELSEDSFNTILVIGSIFLLDFTNEAELMDEHYVQGLHQDVLDFVLTTKTTLDDIESSYEKDYAHIADYAAKVQAEITKLTTIKTALVDEIMAKIDDERFETDLVKINDLLTRANSLALDIETLRQAIATQIAKEQTDLAAFYERWDAILAEYNVLSHTKIISIEIYTNVLNDYADLGEDVQDLREEISEYMFDESFIALDEYNEFVVILSSGFESIEYGAMMHLEGYVNDTYVNLSNKLQAVKTSLETIRNKYSSDNANIRAYYDETRTWISKLDSLIVEAGDYDEAFIYDACIADLIEEMNDVHDDADELSNLIRIAMADSEINRLVALSNSFDEDVALMQNYKENGLNYDGNIKKCDELVSKMNAAIQEIDDNMEILDQDSRLVSARAKLVSSIESVNASKQTIQRDHTIMLVLVIVCPILFVIAVFLLLYFFGFKKRFLRRENKVQ